jgi:ABC-type Zn uptake system ZnuABC Zn-binding protein ZnuA
MKKAILLSLFLLFAAAGCQAARQSGQGALRVLAAETFLAEIAQAVAGDRLIVEALIPAGVDPHGFEPTPRDAARLAESQVFIVNGGGLEAWVERLLENAGGERVLIVASAGMTPRAGQDQEGLPEACRGESGQAEEQEHESDPHFWLAPNLVAHYIENIRDGLIEADPAGETSYRRNAEQAKAQLDALDAWIAAQTAQIPAENRLLVTNHESLGYFADRYGFTLAGSITPSVSSVAAPSAQDLARLSDCIRAAGVRAIFLETGSNTSLANQLAEETGVEVVTGLATHAFPEGGEAQGGYEAMMRHNTELIVAALK